MGTADVVRFPDGFLWGRATCGYQNVFLIQAAEAPPKESALDVSEGGPCGW